MILRNNDVIKIQKRVSKPSIRFTTMPFPKSTTPYANQHVPMNSKILPFGKTIHFWKPFPKQIQCVKSNSTVPI